MPPVAGTAAKRAGRAQPKPWTGPPLVVLDKGPLGGRWYTQPDLQAAWEAAKAMGRGARDTPLLRYRPTTRKMPNPRPPTFNYDAEGTVWTYRNPDGTEAAR